MPSKMKKRMEAEDEAKKALAAAMECEAEDEAKDEQEADAEAMAAGDEAEEMAGAGMKFEESGDAVHVDIGSHQGEESEDEDEEEMEAAYGGKTKMSKSVKAEKALFARVQALESANKNLERQLRLERFGREVDSMLSGGYRCGKFRNQMVEELADCKAPEAKIAFWKSTMARDPINVPPVAAHAVTDESGIEMDVKSATARAVAEAKGDLAKFKSLFAKYSGQKAV